MSHLFKTIRLDLRIKSSEDAKERVRNAVKTLDNRGIPCSPDLESESVEIAYAKYLGERVYSVGNVIFGVCYDHCCVSVFCGADAIHILRDGKPA